VKKEILNVARDAKNDFGFVTETIETECALCSKPLVVVYNIFQDDAKEIRQDAKEKRFLCKECGRWWEETDGGENWYG
jgi:transposase-like protein